MFCETDEEVALFNLLTERYPHKNTYLLGLVAWVFINRPERFNEIMEEHRSQGEEMIDMEDVDIKEITRPAEVLNL